MRQENGQTTDQKEAMYGKMKEVYYNTKTLSNNKYKTMNTVKEK